MREKFVYPENMLNKDQIMNLIIKDEEENQDNYRGADLAGYAESHFGPEIFDIGFRRYSDEEIQEWYYREYLPDRETDIAEGYDRGQ